MKLTKTIGALAAGLLLMGAAACGSNSNDSSKTDNNASGNGFPVTIEHKFGKTVIDKQPKRVATVGDSNQDVPLALGVLPVGMAKATWADEDGDGMMPYVKDKVSKLGGKKPKLFDETDGIDFEAVASVKPDVILAPYSGIKKEDYDKLSKIASVVAYPDGPWLTPWREITKLSAKALGKEAEGAKLIEQTEKTIETEVAKYPALKGKAIMFLTHVDPKDLSTVKFYTPSDTRVRYWEDMGLKMPKSVEKASKAGEYAGSVSAENADVFDDVNLIVTYGDQKLVDLLKSDKLLSQIPALKKGAVVKLDGKTTMGMAAYPSVLNVPELAPEYIKQLGEAVGR